MDPARLEGLSRAEQIEQLRAQMNAVSSPDILPQVEPGDSEYLSVGLRKGLPRRAVTEVADVPALLVEMVQQVTRGGGKVAVLGWPELSVAEIEHLDHMVLVPDPGIDPLAIAGVLVEGLDLVIYRSATELNLSPVRARPLLAKLRAGQAALVLVGLHAPSPAVKIDATVSAYHGIGRGSGRIRGLDIQVDYQDKTARHREVITVGQAPKRPQLRVVD